MSDIEAVLFANEAFYVAFANCDYDAMEDIWAKTGPVTCVHPGWRHLSGRDVVMESWQSILNHPDSENMQFRNPEPVLFGDFAMVICYELLPPNAAVATNCFARMEGVWKMVHHQATLTTHPDAANDQLTPRLKLN